MKLRAVALFLLMATRAQGSELDSSLQALWSGELGSAPASLGILLLEMASDDDLSARVLERASLEQIALTDSLVATLLLTENEARDRLPQLYVVRDNSPARDFRPPSWVDLREVGVRLLERIALDPTQGRDLRLSRALADRRDAMRRETPSEIAGLVSLCAEWWADRGDDPRYYSDPSRLPTVEPWLDGLGDSHGLWDLLARLVDDPLRRRMFLARLDPSTHAALVSECTEILGSYQHGFEERGFAARRWDPASARVRGYHETDLWSVGLEMFVRVAPFTPSGASLDEQIHSAFGWWRRARYQARYWRDPSKAPALPNWLRHPRSEVPIHTLLRDLYVDDELGELYSEELDERHACFVAEWIQWVQYDLVTARAAGFDFAVRRFPLRPEREAVSRMMSVPWDQVREMIVGWLPQLTGHRLAIPDAPLDERVGQWLNWWQGARHDARWYRDSSSLPAGDRSFEPQRARAGD